MVHGITLINAKYQFTSVKITMLCYYSFARWAFARPMMAKVESIELVGEEHLPTQGTGAVLICNHASDIDPGILMKSLPLQLSFLVASFMDNIPVVGTLVRWFGNIIIGTDKWRQQVHERLVGGNTLVVFREGEKWVLAQDFDAPMADFYPGFAAFAYEAKVCIVPIVIQREQVEIVPFQTNPMFRQLAENENEREEPKNVLRPVKCCVRVCEPIPPEAFVDMTKEEAVPWIMKTARARMETEL